MIRLSEPRLFGNELEYVTDALTSRQIAQGPYVERFEAAFADYVGMKYAVSCSSGTAGLHLALLALGISDGEVIVPAISYVATANAVKYVGADVFFQDIWDDSWGMATPDPSPETRAIIITHLYGHAAGVPELWGMPVIEDACEVLGAFGGTEYQHQGAMAVYSFYGNKIITTGEGGMVVTNNTHLAKQLRFYRGQAQSDQRYWHTEVGYNYRLSNLAAALGVAQLETISTHLQKRWKVVNYYHDHLQGITKRKPDAPWLYTFTVSPDGPARDLVMQRLEACGIETRPTFVPLHRLPMYRDGRHHPNAEYLGDQGLSIPTHAGLTDAEVEYIVASVNEAVK